MSAESGQNTSDTIRYTCTTGHAIPEVDLEDLSEVVSLDAGAQVRICREHGAPVRVSLPPGANAET